MLQRNFRNPTCQSQAAMVESAKSGMEMRTRSTEFMPFLLSLLNFKEIGLVWLCLCGSY
ncbi:hypothetical protein CY35_14G011200 [Sphagnum magellanicum]|nr:hypothetical protein CY35_14G011200 [Sphagnum magellanicum]